MKNGWHIDHVTTNVMLPLQSTGFSGKFTNTKSVQWSEMHKGAKVYLFQIFRKKTPSLQIFFKFLTSQQRPVSFHYRRHHHLCDKRRSFFKCPSFHLKPMSICYWLPSRGKKIFWSTILSMPFIILWTSIRLQLTSYAPVRINPIYPISPYNYCRYV